ncbi:hypothetical protein STENM327S_01637 [Streptomyces tendae]
MAKAEQRIGERRARVPAVSYPEQFPVSQKKDEIAAAIRDHQVVIVAGETGSGKTTQIPKICVELGRGVRGMIGHTQPRRIAAVHPERAGGGRLAHAPQVLRGQPPAADRGRGAGAPRPAPGHPASTTRRCTDFYDQRVPEHVVSGAHFDSWWKHKRHEQPDFLDFEREMLINEKAEAVTKDDYPDSWRSGQSRCSSG